MKDIVLAFDVFFTIFFGDDIFPGGQQLWDKIGVE
jgi:hypothetical protein